MLLEFLTAYQREIGLGTLGLMGGVVRILAAKEQMSPSLAAATLISAFILPATGGDLLHDWFNLGDKATGFCAFLAGGVAIKAVLKAQEADLSWPPFAKKEERP